MHRGQTGFVPGQGILVNLMRLIERVTERVKRTKKAYGVFFDLSNAYNTILHSKLFEKLKGILNEDEIQLIKAIYSRIKIKIGKETFTPNVEVAQGSVISPALFNIMRKTSTTTYPKWELRLRIKWIMQMICLYSAIANLISVT